MSEVRLLQGDCLAVLKTLDAQSLNCVITSPPYYGLRDYGTAKWEGGNPECLHRRESKKSDKTITGHKNFDEMLGVGDAIQKSVCAYCGAIRIDSQIGLEQTPDEYVRKLVDVFREVKRVLRDDGTLWLNLGDSYASNGVTGQTDEVTGWQHGTLENEKRSRARGAGNGIKPKDLIGIPWRVAFALQADGWYLRQDIIWAKPNPMPESVKDRCTKSHEYIFLLTKNGHYYYDSESIKDKSIEPNDDRGARGNQKRIPTEKIAGIRASGVYPLANKRSVWTVTTKPFKDAHFATFPEDLIRPCVLAGCPEGGTILDPFNGAGTTGVVAVKNGRNYIGIELNPEYIKMSESRISKARQQMRLSL